MTDTHSFKDFLTIGKDEISFIESTKIQIIDDYLVTKFHSSIAQLMEVAGLRVAEFLRKTLAKDQIILFLIGKGHNGGDGLVAAWYLKQWGYNIQIILAQQSSQLKPLTKQHYERILTLEPPVSVLPTINESSTDFQKALSSSHFIVDALLGIGISRSISDPFYTLVKQCNYSQLSDFSDRSTVWLLF